MTKQFNAGDKITVTSLMHCGTTPDHPDILSKMFTIAKVHLDTNCIETLEKNPANCLGYIFHFTQIALREPNFKFKVEGDCDSYTGVYSAYHPYNGTDDVLVTWPNENNYDMTYGSLEVDKFISQGLWKVLPTLPDSFKFSTTTGIYKMSLGGDGEFGEYICDDKPTCQWKRETIQEYLADGTWKLVEDAPPMPVENGLPDTFSFHTKFGELLCTATKMATGNNKHYVLSWGDNDSNYSYKSEEQILASLVSGEYWLAAPLEDVPKVSSVVLNADTSTSIRINGQDVEGYTLTGTILDLSKPLTEREIYENEEASEICLPQAYSFLDTIKCFTEWTGSDVVINSEGYVVFYGEYEYHADQDEDLHVIMSAIGDLEGAKR